MRIRHDLMGCSNRYHTFITDFRDALKEVQEVWKDARSEQFERTDLKDIDTVVDRLSVSLQEACESLGKMDAALRDEVT